MQHQTHSYGEANALRYAASYVCQAVRKSIRSKGGTSRKELLLCLAELLDDEEGGEDNSCCQQTSDWAELINRGGLLRVTDEVFTVFHAMEKSSGNISRKTRSNRPPRHSRRSCMAVSWAWRKKWGPLFSRWFSNSGSQSEGFH